MLIAAVILSALALGVSGAALALALVQAPRTEPKPVPEAEPDEEKARAERADRRIKEGLSNMMDFDPFRKGGDE
jgi:hypothetical protein